jgi:DNA (cytosine-5)-methyltransferase 1
MRPIAIDLFAGAGGLSLGLEQAGFDVAAAVEIDPIHAATHKFNFPNTAVLATSVVGLSGDAIRRAAGLEDRQVDLVAGGAPCQGFSMIGHRALDDPRNSLVREFVRIVCELDATYFVFENVKGLTVGKHKAFLNELISEFESAGYAVRTPWRVLNAMHFGVPQSRERLFLLGAKRGRRLPEYPQPTTAPADYSARSGDVPVGPTCADAIGDLPDADLYDALLGRDWVETTAWKRPSEFARLMRCLDNDAWHFGYPRKWTPLVLTSSSRTDHSDISRRRFAETPQGQTEPISRFYKLPAAGTCNTLRAGTDAARGAFTSPRPIHYQHPRCVTVREMARLHSFPDWFRFHATKWHGARQIGNSVPPLFAMHVGAAILEAMGVQGEAPPEAIELGDSSLLELDMAAAARLFGVDTPIGRRDRKSGAKKRKQWQVELDLQRTRERRTGT